MLTARTPWLRLPDTRLLLFFGKRGARRGDELLHGRDILILSLSAGTALDQ